MYGGTDGHKFVNGVLDKLAARLREVEVQADERARRHGLSHERSRLRAVRKRMLMFYFAAGINLVMALWVLSVGRGQGRARHAVADRARLSRFRGAQLLHGARG